MLRILKAIPCIIIMSLAVLDVVFFASLVRDKGPVVLIESFVLAGPVCLLMVVVADWVVRSIDLGVRTWDRRGRPTRREPTKRVSGKIGDESPPSIEGPRLGIFLICLLLPKEDQEAVIGDLVELFTKAVQRLGPRWAHILFYKEVATSVLPLIKKALIRLGVLASVEELIRRKLGL